MSKLNDGGPAFPQAATDNNGRIDWPDEMGMGGMRLRDYFAGQALQGLLACSLVDYKTIAAYARKSYEFADAMLAAKNKEAKR